MNWYTYTIKNNYRNSEGRASLREYQQFNGINTLIILALVAPILLSNNLLEEGSLISKIVLTTSGVLLMIYLQFIYLPSRSLTIRRLHDVGLEGKFYLKLSVLSHRLGILGVILLVLSIFLSPIMLILSVIILLIYVLFALGLKLFLYIKLNTEGNGKPNKFGDPPRYYLPS